MLSRHALKSLPSMPASTFQSTLASTLPNTLPSTFPSTFASIHSIALNCTLPARLTVRSQVRSQGAPKYCTRLHTPSLDAAKYPLKMLPAHFQVRSPERTQDAPKFAPKALSSTLQIALDCTLPAYLTLRFKVCSQLRSQGRSQRRPKKCS
jgi:hypothetical protein